MQYVEAAGKGGSPAKGSGCLFCRLARLTPAEDNLILEKTDAALIVLNAFPYNSGHLMVAPLAHRASMGSLVQAERDQVWDGLARCEKALKKVYRPDGLNMGVNIGKPAGAGVLGHVHVHVVPRWNGDTNFMPVIAETKVLPESIDVTWERLRQALADERRVPRKPAQPAVSRGKR
jgi:ATP adenylyltransferase